MKRLSITARLVFALCLVTLGASIATARAEDSRGIVFFGDSLTDPGNHYIAFGQITRPPYQPVPIYPYAMGGHSTRGCLQRWCCHTTTPADR